MSRLRRSRRWLGVLLATAALLAGGCLVARAAGVNVPFINAASTAPAAVEPPETAESPEASEPPESAPTPETSDTPEASTSQDTDNAPEAADSPEASDQH